MAEDRSRCRNFQYFNNKASTLTLTDTVVGQIDEEAQTITMFFPYPFQLIAFATETENWQTSPPVSELPMPLIMNYDRGTTIANQRLLLELFTVMMYANRDVDNYLNSPFLGAIQYQEKALAKFSKYFKSYLNEGLKPYFYNQFLWPPSYIQNFWTEEDTTPSVYLNKDLLNLMRDLFSNSDRRLWGAPGLYTIYYGNEGIPEGDFIEPPLTYSAYSS